MALIFAHARRLGNTACRHPNLKRALRHMHNYRPPNQGCLYRRAVTLEGDIIIGRVINITGMIGVSAGTVLFAFGIVLLLFWRGFGFDISNPFHWFLVVGGAGRSPHLQMQDATNSSEIQRV
jgi:hypothetical protein